MKTFGIIIKIIVALAAIAGIIYVVATYGDRIAAWCKKLLRRRNRNYEYDYDFDYEDDADIEIETESEDFEV